MKNIKENRTAIASSSFQTEQSKGILKEEEMNLDLCGVSGAAEAAAGAGAGWLWSAGTTPTRGARRGTGAAMSRYAREWQWQWSAGATLAYLRPRWRRWMTERGNGRARQRPLSSAAVAED